jgi:MoaA/NifB/PqqE/SkfB family radical SAM enzyme
MSQKILRILGNDVKGSQKVMQELTIDEEFYFQWHLTERCNRACRHCYQDGSPTSFSGRPQALHVV